MTEGPSILSRAERARATQTSAPSAPTSISPPLPRGIHPVDISAACGYIAGGGLAGVFAFLAIVYPTHQTAINGAAIALVAAAGLLRVITNPTEHGK